MELRNRVLHSLQRKLTGRLACLPILAILSPLHTSSLNVLSMMFLCKSSTVSFGNLCKFFAKIITCLMQINETINNSWVPFWQLICSVFADRRGFLLEERWYYIDASSKHSKSSFKDHTRHWNESRRMQEMRHQC